MSGQPACHDLGTGKMSLYDLYQALFERCRRPFLPGPPLECFPFPMEIVHLIVEHLDPVDRLRLSLTCKPFYHTFFPRTLQLSRGEKEDFLLGLERDIARVYYCDHCVKLHPWRPEWARQYVNYNPYNFYCHARQGIDFGVFDLWITYSYARLVMNRHFYGKSHGLPVSVLDNYRHSSDSYGVHVSKLSKARIIKDELYLRRRTEARHPFGREPALKRYLEAEHLRVCLHLYVGTKMQCYDESGKLCVPYGPAGEIIVFEQRGRCGECQTEYEIRMTKRFFTGWNLLIHTYSRIGRCRSSQDPVWIHMEGRERDVENVESLPEFAEGEMSIKDRWLASEETQTQYRTLF